MTTIVQDYKAIRKAAVDDSFLSLNEHQKLLVATYAGFAPVGDSEHWRTYMLVLAGFLKGVRDGDLKY